MSGFSFFQLETNEFGILQTHPPFQNQTNQRSVWWKHVIKLKQTISARLQPQTKRERQNCVLNACNSVNGVNFLCSALSPCSAGTQFLLHWWGQLNTAVKTEQGMCPFGGKILCLCKTWILAYSHTTHTLQPITHLLEVFTELNTQLQFLLFHPITSIM